MKISQNLWEIRNGATADQGSMPVLDAQKSPPSVAGFFRSMTYYKSEKSNVANKSSIVSARRIWVTEPSA